MGLEKEWSIDIYLTDGNHYRGYVYDHEDVTKHMLMHKIVSDSKVLGWLKITTLDREGVTVIRTDFIKRIVIRPEKFA